MGYEVKSGVFDEAETTFQLNCQADSFFHPNIKPRFHSDSLLLGKSHTQIKSPSVRCVRFCFVLRSVLTGLSIRSDFQ